MMKDERPGHPKQRVGHDVEISENKDGIYRVRVDGMDMMSAGFQVQRMPQGGQPILTLQLICKTLNAKNSDILVVPGGVLPEAR